MGLVMLLARMYAISRPTTMMKDRMMNSCQSGEWQARDKERAGQALRLMAVPTFDKEEVFFAETVVFDVRQIRIGDY